MVYGRPESHLVSKDPNSAIISALSNLKYLSCLFRQMNLSKYKAIHMHKRWQDPGSAATQTLLRQWSPEWLQKKYQTLVP